MSFVPKVKKSLFHMRAPYLSPDILSCSKRILLKVSGEALKGPLPSGFHQEAMDSLARQVGFLRNKGIEVAIVIGGGNWYRGNSLTALGIDKPIADNIGMLSTVMNGIALQEIFKKNGLKARTFSHVPIRGMVEDYTFSIARESLSESIAICTGGIGNPFVSTDTAAVLRALELQCSVLLKATTVDGVYTADPSTHKDVKHLSQVSYNHMIQEQLGVMDFASLALARDYHLPILVFSIIQHNSISALWNGVLPYTLITERL